MMHAALAPLSARWSALAPREKLMVAAAAALVAIAIAWWVLLAPALATLRGAGAQRQALDAQLQRMMSLQAQAQSLQSVPRMSPDEASRQLDLSVRQSFGPGARLAITGDRATLTLSAVAPDALARGLAQARANARLTPTDAHLTRNAAGQWDGTLSFTLPAR
ncbi:MULTISPECIES: type II secretion system protein GspM [Ramlibacter]|uniref:Type II secretion system protein M n=1 Tax=Ramlibacter aquaticus TaxID=2780094 RepID=A0ABR9SK20_9BURK|nr:MULTISPECIES: type II secretion system protein GspM [Ramlibacter]MBE7942714.1 type II secretion system protein M [Ramlibacter aquaticus]